MSAASAGAAPTVFIVDDDAAVVKALSRVIKGAGWQVETFDSAEAFLARPQTETGGCMVLDVNLPGLDGLELQGRLAQAGHALPIIFLSGQGDIPMSVRAIKAGAVDFLTKPVPAAALLKAVAAAIEQAAATPQAQGDIALIRQRLDGLTPREREVLAAVVSGKRNKQIAANMGIVEQTVKFHRARIMERMQAKSAAELMFIIAQLGNGRELP